MIQRNHDHSQKIDHKVQDHRGRQAFSPQVDNREEDPHDAHADHPSRMLITVSHGKDRRRKKNRCNPALAEDLKPPDEIAPENDFFRGRDDYKEKQGQYDFTGAPGGS